MSGLLSSRCSRTSRARPEGPKTTQRGLNKRSKLKVTIRYPKTIRKLNIVIEQNEDGHDALGTEDGWEEPKGSTVSPHENSFHDIHEYPVKDRCKHEASEASSARCAVMSNHPSIERHREGPDPSWTELGIPRSQETVPALHQLPSKAQRAQLPPAYEMEIIEMESDFSEGRASGEALGGGATKFGDENILD